jgi:hypothetical protein
MGNDQNQQPGIENRESGNRFACRFDCRLPIADCRASNRRRRLPAEKDG